MLIYTRALGQVCDLSFSIKCLCDVNKGCLSPDYEKNYLIKTEMEGIKYHECLENQ